MAYTKQTWENLPSTNTPITADRLNHIEDGIKLLGQYYYRPEGWQKTKTWNTTKPQKFDYTDVNRSL